MIRAVLFDCWGTLFYMRKERHPFADFAEQLGHDINDPAFRRQFETRLMCAAHTELGTCIEELLQDIQVTHSPAGIAELAALVESRDVVRAAFPDVQETLEQLTSSYQLGLVTNTTSISLELLREAYPLDEWFAAISASCYTGVLKPDPAAFTGLLDELGVAPEEAVMVGDTWEDDVLGAERTGMRAILLDRTGRYPSHENRITSLAELPALLQK